MIKPPRLGKQAAYVVSLILALALPSWAELVPGSIEEGESELATLSAYPIPGPKLNDCPVILVHGIVGYGQDARIPISAWGGMADYRALLVREGWNVHSASLGPLSSNWDRACELFAYIRGGRVDYGAAHSARCGHARFGREQPGVLDNWDEAHKVNLLCHSMGGQTGRLLALLLEEGVAEECAASPGDVSELFRGGHHWILGIVTLASPHDGSTLALVADRAGEAFTRSVALIIAASSPPYDPILDHWGLDRRGGESVAAYASRLMANDSWYRGEDGCYRELHPAGASAFNARVPACPDIYYFSWADRSTIRVAGLELGDLDLNTLLLPTALLMAAPGQVDGNLRLGPEWAANDGVVNTVSMDGPKNGSKDLIVKYEGTPLRGAWNHMGCLASTDHIDLLVMPTPPWYAPPGFDSSADWYRYNMRLLASLAD